MGGGDCGINCGSVGEYAGLGRFTKNLNQDSRTPSRYLNLRTPNEECRLRDLEFCYAVCNAINDLKNKIGLNCIERFLSHLTVKALPPED